MENYWFLVIILIILWRVKKRQKKEAAVLQIKKRKKGNKERMIMKELAMQFMGKECIIYTINSDFDALQGVIKEIGEGGMIIERKSGEQEIVNLDFVLRIREIPEKKGRKKKEN